jgi:prophage regulatory protein
MDTRQAPALAEQRVPQSGVMAMADSLSPAGRASASQRQRPSKQILRMPEVCGRVGVARSTIYDWMDPNSARHAPAFPVPVKLSSGGAIGWFESELDAWLATRQRAKQS